MTIHLPTTLLYTIIRHAISPPSAIYYPSLSFTILHVYHLPPLSTTFTILDHPPWISPPGPSSIHHLHYPLPSSMGITSLHHPQPPLSSAVLLSELICRVLRFPPTEASFSVSLPFGRRLTCISASQARRHISPPLTRVSAIIALFIISFFLADYSNFVLCSYSIFA